MPVLDNHRHELFAQALAAGDTADGAYVSAGYKRNDGNAIRLKGDERICARIQEIQQAACDRIIVERTWLLEQLHLIASVELGHANVSVGEKRKALVDIARLEGWIVDRHEHKGSLTITHEEALAKLE